MFSLSLNRTNLTSDAVCSSASSFVHSHPLFLCEGDVQGSGTSLGLAWWKSPTHKHCPVAFLGPIVIACLVIRTNTDCDSLTILSEL